MKDEDRLAGGDEERRVSEGKTLRYPLLLHRTHHVADAATVSKGDAAPPQILST
jgi:hypothetical protein